MNKKPGIQIVFDNLIETSTGERVVVTVPDNFDMEKINRTAIRLNAQLCAERHSIPSIECKFFIPTKVYS